MPQATAHFKPAGALTITRTGGTVALEGFWARTSEQLLDVAGSALESRLVSDLTLGPWRSHHVASELLAQLDPSSDAAPEPICGYGTRPTGGGLADGIAAGIEAESRGDRATLAALRNAHRVCELAAADGTPDMIVLAPCFEAPWDRENVLFLRFLAQGLTTVGGTLRIGCAGPRPTPPPPGLVVEWASERGRGAGPAVGAGDSSLALFPGVIPPDVASAAAAPKQLSLRHGFVLVPPELRRDPSGAEGYDEERLRGHDWLAAYGQYRRGQGARDAAGLSAYAWKCFADGSWGLAARLLGRAVACAPAPDMRGNFEAQAQGMRIAMQEFAAAAAGPDPTPLDGPRRRAFLLESKGWALTMLNEPRRAEDYLAAARDLVAKQDEDGSRDYLYLLNISSLNKLRLGDAEGAMAMEEEIRSVHERLPRRDWPLEYVNSINIARLQRRRGELEASELSYRRAFATTLGARSEVDLVYTNLMLARLYEAMGRDDESAAAWIRTALHWLASDAPEALGPRATAAFLGRPVADGEDLVEAVSGVLHDRLAAVTQLEADDEAGVSVIPYHRLDAAVAPTQLEGVGAPGWGVLVAPGEAPATVTSASFDGLRSIVGGLAREAGAPAEAGTVVVDNRFGCDVPISRDELLELCLKRGADRLVFDGVPESLSPDRRRAMEEGLRVSLGPAVAAVESVEDGAVVTFKRYLPPAHLGPEAARLVEALAGEPSVAELEQSAGTDTRTTLRALEEARVVRLRLVSAD